MNLEREAQYFGISPVSVVDNVITSVSDYVADVLDASEKMLKEKDELKANPKQIEESIDKVLSLLKANVDKNFDKFELYTLNNVFRIPDDLALPTDKEPTAKVLVRHDEKLDNDIEELKRKVLAAHYVNETIRQRQKAVEAELKVLEPLAERLVQLNTAARSNHLPNTLTIIRDSIQQAQKLQELLKQVQQSNAAAAVTSSSS